MLAKVAQIGQHIFYRWPGAWGQPQAFVGRYIGADLINEQTGEVRVVRYVACHDVGHAIDRQRVEGQIQGAVAEGVGYALSEEVAIEEGESTSPLVDDYLIPTALDQPDITAIVLELYPGKGPLGARGIGEPPIGPPAAAVASAIAEAIGVRLCELPMTPERVLRALNEAAERPAALAP